MPTFIFPCVNCRKPVPGGEEKFFASVFLCAGCHLIAERLYERAQRELRQLLTMQREVIRLALVEQRLHLKQGNPEELSKTDVLRAVMELVESRSKSTL